MTAQKKVLVYGYPTQQARQDAVRAYLAGKSLAESGGFSEKWAIATTEALKELWDDQRHVGLFMEYADETGRLFATNGAVPHGRLALQHLEN